MIAMPPLWTSNAVTLLADVTAPFDASLKTVVPLYLKSKSLSPVSNSIDHLLDPNNIAFPFVSKLPPSCGVVSESKSVGIEFTLAFAPVPSAKTIVDVPFGTATVDPNHHLVL